MKKLLSILFVCALIATPALAEETYRLYGGTDTLNDTVNDYEQIAVWNDGVLTVDYAEQTTHGNPSDTAAVMDNATLILNDGIYEGFVGAPFYYGNFDIDGDGNPESATGATLIINGGTYHYRMGGSDGVLDMTVNGGMFSNEYDSGSGTYMKATSLTINGGTFNPGVAAQYRIQADTLAINGGTFNAGTRISSGNDLTITGGDFNGVVYFIYGDSNAVTTISGGDFTGVEAWGSYQDYPEIHISGGDFSNTATPWTGDYDYVAPTYHFYGQDYVENFFGKVDAYDGGTWVGYDYFYEVSLTLCDGSTFHQFGSFRDNIADSFFEAGAPTFIFHECEINEEPIPEPTTIALLGLGALGLAGARRRR